MNKKYITPQTEAVNFDFGDICSIVATSQQPVDGEYAEVTRRPYYLDECGENSSGRRFSYSSNGRSSQRWGNLW